MTELTIKEAQLYQPWTVPYSAEVRDSEISHILGSHVTLHAMKTVGKIAAIFEALDHCDAALPSSEQLEAIEDMAADLTTAALRLANLYSFDLEEALRRRVEEKNGVGYKP